MSETRNTGQPACAGIFSAADLKRRMAEREAARAAEELRRMQVQEEQQKAVMRNFNGRRTARPNS
jgi:RNA 3'-terminal phosphate cyclase